MNKGEVFVYRLQGALYVNLTNKCCNNCSFCIRNNGDGVQGNTLWLSREPSAAEVIEKLKSETDYDEVVFCGYGESTYRLDVLTEVAKYLKSIGKKTRLNTNGLGSLINGFDITKEISGCIDKVSISLNASNAAEYNAICKPKFKEEAYGAICDFAKSCAAQGMDTIFTVVDVIGEEEIKKCEQVAKQCNTRLKVRKFITNNETYI